MKNRRPPLEINGVAVLEQQRAPIPRPTIAAKQRIFDHLDGTPEDARFSKIARAMHASPFWSSIPERDEPADAAGCLGDSQ